MAEVRMLELPTLAFIEKATPAAGDRWWIVLSNAEELGLTTAAGLPGGRSPKHNALLGYYGKPFNPHGLDYEDGRDLRQVFYAPPPRLAQDQAERRRRRPISETRAMLAALDARARRLQPTLLERIARLRFADGDFREVREEREIVACHVAQRIAKLVAPSVSFSPKDDRLSVARGIVTRRRDGDIWKAARSGLPPGREGRSCFALGCFIAMRLLADASV